LRQVLGVTPNALEAALCGFHVALRAYGHKV
jgi:hypothetical protein